VYTGHRKFLPRYHPYRRRKKAFNGQFENGVLSGEPLTGSQVYEKVKHIEVSFGKSIGKNGSRASSDKTPWKKCSIFFELPYWKDLYVRHSLDVMHIEKNICDSLLGTLLNIPGKTKDGLNSRLDMIEMGIRPELAPLEKGNRTYLPPAMHTLSKEEKLVFCRSLHDTKVPTGFSSNIRSLISLQDLKLGGLKSHDCHVLMQHMIPIAIRSTLPNPVRIAITNLCLFFKKICSHTQDPDELDMLQDKVVETVCQLEMYFPPSFFDIMVHLTVHIVREVKLCGPVCFRWMYPFEREMKVMKGYVRNRYRPEASIVESYITEEVLEFVTDYLASVKPIGVPENRHAYSADGRGIRGMNIVRVEYAEILHAHLYILNNNDEVEPSVEEHKKIIDTTFRNKGHMWRVNEHNRTFSDWIHARVQSLDGISHTLKWLSRKPSTMVITYSAYEINGFTFYTESKDQRSTVQNSGVSISAKAVHFASSKDSNPVTATISYYGVILEIWEIDYGQFRVPVFKCKWFDDSKSGKIVDELGFTMVNFDRQSHTNEPFVLASQVKQVFYKRDPKTTMKGDWHIVLDGRRKFSPGEDESDDDDESNAGVIGPSTNMGGIDDSTFISTRAQVDGHWVDTPNQQKTT